MSTHHPRSYVESGLVSALDRTLRDAGFARSGQSVVYTRNLNQAIQTIQLLVDYFPRYEPRAEAHIRPTIHVRIPSVSEQALRLVHGDRSLLSNAPDVILNQPLDLFAPKDKHERWFAFNAQTFSSTCESIRTFLQDWGITFLSTFSGPSDIVKKYEDRDSQIVSTPRWFIFVAAAYQLLDQEVEAAQVLERHLGKPGLRKRFAKVLG